MVAQKINEAFYGRNFPCVVVIDPGIKSGYAIWSGSNRKPTEYGVTGIGEGRHIFKILFGLLLIEDQYYGSFTNKKTGASYGNPQTLKSLAINVGRWTERGNANGYEIETVHPKTWQSAIGAVGRRPEIKKCSSLYAKILTGDDKISQDAADAIALGQSFIDANKIGIP